MTLERRSHRRLFCYIAQPPSYYPRSAGLPRRLRVLRHRAPLHPHGRETSVNHHRREGSSQPLLVGEGKIAVAVHALPLIDEEKQSVVEGFPPATPSPNVAACTVVDRGKPRERKDRHSSTRDRPHRHPLPPSCMPSFYFRHSHEPPSRKRESVVEAVHHLRRCCVAFASRRRKEDDEIMPTIYDVDEQQQRKRGAGNQLKIDGNKSISGVTPSPLSRPSANNSSASATAVHSGGTLLTGLHLSPRRSSSEMELGGDLFWKAAGNDGVKEDCEDGRRLLKLQDDGVRCHHSSQQSNGDVLPLSAGIVAE
nr:hypothetical protein Iba_chr06bCG11980 [Ipomoea batatas]